MGVWEVEFECSLPFRLAALLHVVEEQRDSQSVGQSRADDRGVCVKRKSGDGEPDGEQGLGNFTTNRAGFPLDSVEHGA